MRLVAEKLAVSDDDGDPSPGVRSGIAAAAGSVCDGGDTSLPVTFDMLPGEGFNKVRIAIFAGAGAGADGIAKGSGSKLHARGSGSDG